MKKALFILTIISLGAFAACKQKSATVKQAETTSVNSLTKPLLVEREKFDPQRNASDDLQTAIARAQKENKRIILDVGGEWCGWCRKMDYYFLENKALAKFRDDKFIWVKVNFSPENENKEFLTKFPPISGYPHLFVLETDGSLLHSQDTALLQEPNLPIMVKQGDLGHDVAEKKANERSYDLFKFVEFLKFWSSQ